MSSSLAPIPKEIQVKEEPTFRNATESKLQCKRYRQENSKLTGCALLARTCFGEKIRPSAGLCMIAFAVPLIVPGITLTVVAFEDGTGFSKYGALHVLGFVLLAVAILLTAAGIVLNTRFQSKIIPDESTYELPAHEKTIVDLDSIVSSSPNENLHKDDALTAVFVPSTPSFIHIDNTEENRTEGNYAAHLTTAEVSTYSNSGQKHVTFSGRKGSRRKFSSNKSCDDYSSSLDSIDSEDFSSGSYILSEELGWERPILELEFEMDNAQEINELKSFSTFKPDQDHFKKPVFSFGDVNSYSNRATGSRFSFQSKEDTVGNLNEGNNDCVQHHLNNSKSKIDRCCDELPGDNSQTNTDSVRFANEYQEEENSPGSRQRLYGLSSDVSMASSDSQITSRDSLKTGDDVLKDTSDSNSSVFSLERLAKSAGDATKGDCSTDIIHAHNLSDSNSSVFFLDCLTKPTEDTTEDGCSAMIILAPNSKSNPLKTWAQSPPTKRPNSFPCGADISGPAGGMPRNNSLKEKHITSLDEFSR